MGAYDEVCDIAVKCIPPECNFRTYTIGDPIDLESGLYIGYEGWFVVNKKNRVLACGKNIFNKWGGTISLDRILDPYSPILKVIEEVTFDLQKGNFDD